MAKNTDYGLKSDCTYNSLSTTAEKDNTSSECTSETLESKLSDLLTALRRNGSDNWLGKPHMVPLEEFMTGSASSFHDLHFSSNKESAEHKLPLAHRGSPKVSTGGSGGVETAKQDEKTFGTVVQEAEGSLEDLMELYISNLRQLRQADSRHCHGVLSTGDMRPTTSDSEENVRGFRIPECGTIVPNPIARQGNRQEIESTVCSDEESENSALSSGCTKNSTNLADLADLATTLAEVLSESTVAKLGETKSSS